MSKLLTNETANTSLEQNSIREKLDVAFDALVFCPCSWSSGRRLWRGTGITKRSASYATSRLNLKGLLAPATQPGSAATQGPGPSHFFRAFRNFADIAAASERLISRKQIHLEESEWARRSPNHPRFRHSSNILTLDCWLLIPRIAGTSPSRLRLQERDSLYFSSTSGLLAESVEKFSAPCNSRVVV